MLRPEYFEGKADRILELYERLENFILRDIARRILKSGKITATADRLLYRLEQLGESRDEIQRRIMELTDLSEKELRKLLRGAVLTSWEDDAVTLSEMGIAAQSPLENARLKAKGYYEAFHIPVFSCDSGLYFDNVPDEIQPGVHVRNVNGKRLSDDEMIDYYSGLVKIYGNLVARYKNAICFVMDDTHMYEAMEPSMESEKFILTDKPHSTIRKEGFPLDSISLEINTNKYYYDLPEDKLEQVAVEDGFLEFFKNIYCACEKDSFIPGEI